MLSEKDAPPVLIFRSGTHSVKTVTSSVVLEENTPDDVMMMSSELS